MKHSERLIQKVTKRFWNTFSPKDWHPAKHLRFWGVVREFEKGIASCELRSYSNDFDNYDIGQTFMAEFKQEEFPTDVEEGLLFEFIITDYEDLKKNSAEYKNISKLPDMTHSIICKLIKTTSYDDTVD